MPISRDARTDRRRRLLRDNTEMETGESSVPRRNALTHPLEIEDLDGSVAKRKAGYSQDVRKACGQRLVQLIPVRRRSFAGVVFISLLIPGLLLAAHYFVHVTGQLQWWRHPLAIAMDIGHPRSIAAWLCSQLWLLCLGATVLTFQLRRHKLDDYNGEYRLWFWLVLTCLIASIDSTTNVTELFALALDPWAQTRLGWSGPAVVDATLAVLIGMLGLRMCGELKSVPMSLVCWLIGLVQWSGSAALARPEFLLNMPAPIRYWLTAALWISGLTMIWLAALTYLRNVYIEAQKRFLLRGQLATRGLPLGQRLRESLPNLPRFRRGERTADEAPEGASVQRQGSRWALPGLPAFMRRRKLALDSAAPEANPKRNSRSRKQATDETSDLTSTEGVQVSPARTARHETPHQQRPDSVADRAESGASAKVPDTSPRRGLSSFLKGSRTAAATTTDSSAEAARQSGPSSTKSGTKSLFGSWLRRAKHSDDAEEYRKISSDRENRPDNSTSNEQRRAKSTEQQKTPVSSDHSNTDSHPRTARRWLPKLSRPKLSIPRMPRPKLGLPKFSRSKSTDPPKEKSEKKSFLSRFKLPSLSLSALKLQPPEDSRVSQASATQARDMRPVTPVSSQLPGTNPVADQDVYFDEDENDGRPLSKAERKRLRRNQQQRRSA